MSTFLTGLLKLPILDPNRLYRDGTAISDDQIFDHKYKECSHGDNVMCDNCEIWTVSIKRWIISLEITFTNSAGEYGTCCTSSWTQTTRAV